MQKLILLSVIIATFAIPIAMRRRRLEGREYRALLVPFALYCLVYVGLLLYVYPRLG